MLQEPLHSARDPLGGGIRVLQQVVASQHDEQESGGAALADERLRLTKFRLPYGDLSPVFAQVEECAA